MIERGKSLLDLRADALESDDKCEAEVAYDGASQQPATLIISVDIRRHVDGRVGRPRHAPHEQVKPSPNLGDVETEHERQRNSPGEIVAVYRQRFELPISPRHSILACNNVYYVFLHDSAIEESAAEAICFRAGRPAVVRPSVTALTPISRDTISPYTQA